MERHEEQRLISQYNARFNKAKTSVEPKHRVWKTIEMFDKGDQWKDASLPPWIPKPMENWMRYVRTLKRANLASAIPSAHYTARDPQYMDVMQRLQRAYEHVWETEKVPRVIRRCIDRGTIQGTQVVIVYNDDQYVGGTYLKENDPGNKLYQGKICVKRFPLYNFFPDPDAIRLVDCKYVETTETSTLRAVKNNPVYKEYAGEKLAKITTQMLAQDEIERGRAPDPDAIDNTQNIIGDEEVTIHTHWERYITEEGRWRVDLSYYLAGADFFLYRIEDVKPSVYPMAVYYDEEEEDFWGSATLADILENQKIINKTNQTASIIGTLHQNPQKVVARDSGINAQDLARTGTYPGKVWTSNIDPNNSIVNIQPPDIPKGLFDLHEHVKNGTREIVGINEAYTGQSVGSLTTSTGVNSLIERATIRDKDKMIQIDEFVEQISDLIVLHIMYKWKNKRSVPVTVKGKTEYHEYEPLDETTIDNLEWICKSDVYAKAPTTQALRKEQANNMMTMQGQFQFDPPIITPEEWIRFQDFDMKDETLQRMAKDRERMEKEKALNMSQNLLQIADTIRQNIAQGMPLQEAQAQAQQFIEKLLADQGKQERANGRGRDAAKANGPQGTTGATAMAAMAKGS